MVTEWEYKLAKEAHVSDCTGGSVHEVSLIGGVILLSHTLWIVWVRSGLVTDMEYIPQFMLYVLPVLFSVTLLSEYIPYVAIILVSAILLSSFTPHKQVQSSPDAYRSYLTIYRAGTMLLTCIAILAVDFQVFPRRFAKVEDFGTSLMDVGVGSFVFSSGVVSYRVYMNDQPMIKALLRSLRTAFPILLLGFIRFYLTKSVNYQEHNSEYGLHWNFFITLGLLPPFVTMISFLRRYVPFSLLGLSIAVLYQYVLMNGLEDWILNAPRVDMISANKEGISSFSGYLAIFLLGLECGTLIFQEKNKMGLGVFLYGLMMWIGYGVWTYFFSSDVSRKEANLPYILWVVGFNLLLLSGIITVESVYGYRGRGPMMMDSINRNGLFSFLLANLLTGLINLSMRTLYMDSYASMIVLLVYILIVTSVPTVLWHHYQIRVKL